MSSTWASGSNGTVRIARETTYATQPTGNFKAFGVPFNSLDLTMNQPLSKSATISSNRNPTKPFRGNKDVTGSIVIPYDLRSIGLWLKLLFGSPTTTGASDPYSHVFKIGSSTPSYCIEKGFSDVGLYYLYNGIMASNFSLSFSSDGGTELTSSIGLLGASETKDTASMFGDTTGETDWTSVSEKLYAVNGAISLADGSITACITEFTLNYDAALEGVYCIGGSGLRGDMTTGQASVNGSITAKFADDTLLLYGRGDSEFNIVTTFTYGTHSLVFDIGEALINYNSPPISGPNGVFVTLDYEAYYSDDADASALKVTLSNAVASYSNTII